MKLNKELEADLRWQRHGKKWKTKYFDALKDLYQDKDNGESKQKDKAQSKQKT